MKTALKIAICLFMTFGLSGYLAAQDVYYDPVAEWNGPQYHIMNGSGQYSLGMVDDPVIDIPYEGSNSAVVWFDGVNYLTAVVDEVHDRIQFFITDIFIAEENTFTWVGPGAPAAAGQYNASQIWFNPGPANTIVPGSEALAVNDVIWNRVENLAGYTASDRVYRMDYTGGAGGGSADFPALSLADGDAVRIRYANSTSVVDGEGDIDYLKAGVGAAGGLIPGQTVQIDEVYPTTAGAPATFENLVSVAVNPSIAAIGVMDLYVVDAGDALEKLFAYRINSAASVFEWVSTYDGPLSNPMDVDIVESGDNTLYVPSAVTQFTTLNTPQLSITVLNNALVSNHTYSFTVINANPVAASFTGLILLVGDVTTGKTLNILAPTGAGPVSYVNVIPGLGITWTNLPIPASAVVNETAVINAPAVETVIRDFIFICDSGNDRIKIIKGAENGVAAGNGIDGDYFAGDEHTDIYWISDGATPSKGFISACRAEENSFNLYTGSAAGRVQWSRVDNFRSSAPGDLHYTYDYDTQVITLGDGVFGAIPAGGDTALAVFDESIDALDYGDSGTGEANFNNPEGIAAHYNSNHNWYDVYVSDTGNNRVVKLKFFPGPQSSPGSASIHWVTSWNTVSGVDDTLNSPTDLAVEDDASGQLYLFVCDSDNDRVVVYRDTEAELGGGGGASAPQYASSFGELGTSLGYFSHPRGVTTVDYGDVIDVYIADAERWWVEKYQAVPVPVIDVSYGNINPGGYPPDGSYVFTAVNPTFTLYAPLGAYVQFFFSDSIDAVNPTLCSNTQVSPTARTFTWVFSQTPSGTPDDGNYYLYARLFNSEGLMIAQDVSSEVEIFTIRPRPGEGLSAIDALDDDRYLYLQNNAERVINFTIDNPDSITGISYQGTYPSAFLKIMSFERGPAWQSVQHSATIFNAAWDSASGTFSVNSAVLGSNTGLTGGQRYVAARGRVKVRATAVTLERRNTYGEFALLQGTTVDYRGAITNNPTLNDLNLRFAYLGDLAAVDSAIGSPPNMVPYPDGRIDFEDLVAFSKGWSGVGGWNDAIADIGPASGVVPDLVAAPDGAWDVFDLIAFTRMFRWFNQLNLAASAGASGGLAIGGNSGIITLDASREGGDYLLTIGIEEVRELMSAELFVEFDPAVCELISLDEGNFLGLGDNFFHHFQRDDRLEIYISRLDRNGEIYGHELAAARFKVSAEAEPAFIIVYDLRDTEGMVIECGRFGFCEDGFPSAYVLRQNYPNPFNPETTIEFELPAAGKVKIAVYNLKGELVAEPLNEFLSAGAHSVVWDGRSVSGESLASGIYFYALESGSFKTARKMVLLK